jgi:glycosyltransferase involved in cell wall biosynthesis
LGNQPSSRQATKKVAIVSTLHRVLADFAFPHMRTLQEMGYEVHVYGNGSRRRHELEEAGFICHDFPIKRKPFRFNNLRALWFLIKEFRKHKFELIHCHTPMGGALARIAGICTGQSLMMYTAHGFHFFTGAPFLNWLLYYPVEKILARYTQCLIVVNQEDFARAKNKLHVGGEVLHIPEFTDVNEVASKAGHREAIRAELGLKPTDLVVVYIAEFILRKNHIQLIEAVEQLKNPDLKCILLGDGVILQLMKDAVHHKKMDANFIFLGYRRNATELIHAADISMLLSFHEGLPVCLLESLAASKPIIATQIRGNIELVEECVNGFLVPFGDVDATVTALNWCLEHKDQLDRMGAESFRKAAQFDISLSEKAMREVYQRLLPYAVSKQA